MDTNLTKAKLCLICKDTTHSYSSGVHSGFWKDWHETNGMTWQPTKGHKDYELHLRMIKLIHN